MPNCLYPITVDRGYKSHARALSRWIIAGRPEYRKPTRYISVRCGHCPNCLRQKRREWLLRLHYQGLQSEHPNYFVTLTYAVEPRQGVLKKDVQDFMKRLRHTTKQKVKYFLCSEYGEKHLRAHYHMILFNYDQDPDLIAEAWKHGMVKIGSVTDASINYVAKYFITKQNHPEGKNENFSLISKGIGKCLVSAEYEKFLQAGNMFKIEGSRVVTPRYIKDKMNINEFEIEYEPTEIHKDLEILLDRFGGNAELAVKTYNANIRKLNKELQKRKNDG